MTDPWQGIVGQTAAISTLSAWVPDPVHAFLFTGPSGSGKLEAAFAFAGAILAHGEEASEGERHLGLALGRKHPDVELFAPQANVLSVKIIEGLIPLLYKKPVEGRRRIVIVDRFHDASAEAAGALLKPVEEPPPGTMIILLRENVLPEHVAIASRCLEVSFPALPSGVVAEWLVGRGVAGDAAGQIAMASAGDLRRAEMLVTDESFSRRSDAWHLGPTRLDGTGYAAGRVVVELRELIDEAVGIVKPFHERELQELDEREELLGTRGSGRKEIEERHKREVRKIRTDELRFGLAVLARRYSERLTNAGGPQHVAAIELVREANEALVRNPNESLLLQNLFWHLPALAD